jgi:arginyl-tRNA synthetase
LPLLNFIQEELHHENSLQEHRTVCRRLPAGIKLLGSNDAKNAYTHAAAAVLRMKDCVMNTVDTVRENADDILHAAKDINEQRAAEAEAAAAEIEDCAEEIADEMAADAAPVEA